MGCFCSSERGVGDRVKSYFCCGLHVFFSSNTLYRFLGAQARKKNLENKSVEIQNAIEQFQKPKVYVKMD